MSHAKKKEKMDGVMVVTLMILLLHSISSQFMKISAVIFKATILKHSIKVLKCKTNLTMKKSLLITT